MSAVTCEFCKRDFKHNGALLGHLVMKHRVEHAVKQSQEGCGHRSGYLDDDIEIERQLVAQGRLKKEDAYELCELEQGQIIEVCPGVLIDIRNPKWIEVVSPFNQRFIDAAKGELRGYWDWRRHLWRFKKATLDDVRRVVTEAFTLAS